jgi:tRNA threonylcarbamoyladenosine biosynthesis protein TsaB
VTVSDTLSQAGSSRPDLAPPLLLAIETAGSGCSATIRRGAETLAVERRMLRHGHAEILMPLVDRVARAARLTPSNLDIVAVATGPGGFTGIRVGLAAAHGIALAAGARLVGVTSFAAVAAAARRRDETVGASALLVVLDSRRDDLYAQLFAADCVTALAAPVALPPDRLARHVAGLTGGAALLIAGDCTELAAAALGREQPVSVLPDSAPDALGVAAAALAILRNGAPDGPVRPLYLRPPDVTAPRPRERTASRPVAAP